jgi:hypothetical protein
VSRAWARGRRFARRWRWTLAALTLPVTVAVIAITVWGRLWLGLAMLAAGLRPVAGDILKWWRER